MKMELDLSKYEPGMRAALEKLRHLQVEEGLVMKVETMEVSEDGAILLDPDNPEHREWFGDEAYDEDFKD